MTYVALLRGINVGGNNKVEMKKLQHACEVLGLENVRTYINSGNLIFADSKHSPAQLTTLVEKAIHQSSGLTIQVVLRDLTNLKKVVAKIPATWVNDATMKCDVLFLWEEIDSPQILQELPTPKTFEDACYVSGAVIWRLDRAHVTSSSLLKIMGTKHYRAMTIRNCNTVRKLAELMSK